VQHGARDGAAQSYVNFLDAGAVDETARVFWLDAAARHNDDPAYGLLHQLRDGFLSIERRRFSSGGEDAIDTSGATVFQRKKQIAAHVESAAEGDSRGTRQICQLASARHVDISSYVEDPEDHAIGSPVAWRARCRAAWCGFVVVATEVADGSLSEERSRPRRAFPR
jgi:hypothetical protein